VGVVHHGAAHGLGGEEVPARVPGPNLFLADQSEVRLMGQRRGLQRLPRLLPREPPRRELAQLVVDERQELLRGVRVALPNGVQEARDFGHHTAFYPPGRARRSLLANRKLVVLKLMQLQWHAPCASVSWTCARKPKSTVRSGPTHHGRCEPSGA
jgi:hypothetical protein